MLWLKTHIYKPILYTINIMKKIFIDIFSPRNKIHLYYIQAYREFIKKHNVDIYVFSQEFLEEDKVCIQKYSSERIFFKSYGHSDELFYLVSTLNTQYSIIYINTFSESMIEAVHKIRITLDFPYTQEYTLFRDKMLQRKLLLEKYSEVSIVYKKGDDICRLWENDFIFPAILKPRNWVQSQSVQLMSTYTQLQTCIKNITNINNYILEEYIDGEMYSVDYFVDVDKNFTINQVVSVWLWEKVCIHDYANIFSKLWDKNDIEKSKLKEFIQKNIEACGLRNTFIHHEFKKNSRWELKTIELNGRIGWYRLEMYMEAYGYNLLNAIFMENNHNMLKNNIATIALYPVEEGILQSYNQVLFSKIKELSSFYSLRIFPKKYVWKYVGHTKNWYGKIGTIRLLHKDMSILEDDIEYIRIHYKDLLIIEPQ